jgi:hypothetical protein
MPNQSNPVRNTLLIVGGVLGMLLIFSVVLRAALAPLYQEMAHMQSGGGSSGGGDSYSGGGGGNSGGGSDVNLGGVGGLLNWAFGWAWGGAGWYNAGPAVAGGVATGGIIGTVLGIATATGMMAMATAFTATTPSTAP